MIDSGIGTGDCTVHSGVGTDDCTVHSGIGMCHCTVHSGVGTGDCTVHSGVGTGDFSFVLEILRVFGHVHVRSLVFPGMDWHSPQTLLSFGVKVSHGARSCSYYFPFWIVIFRPHLEL